MCWVPHTSAAHRRERPTSVHDAPRLRPAASCRCCRARATTDCASTRCRTNLAGWLSSSEGGRRRVWSSPRSDSLSSRVSGCVWLRKRLARTHKAMSSDPLRRVALLPWRTKSCPLPAHRTPRGPVLREQKSQRRRPTLPRRRTHRSRSGGRLGLSKRPGRIRFAQRSCARGHQCLRGSDEACQKSMSSTGQRGRPSRAKRAHSGSSGSGSTTSSADGLSTLPFHGRNLRSPISGRYEPLPRR